MISTLLQIPFVYLLGFFEAGTGDRDEISVNNEGILLHGGNEIHVDEETLVAPDKGAVLQLLREFVELAPAVDRSAVRQADIDRVEVAVNIEDAVVRNRVELRLGAVMQDLFLRIIPQKFQREDSMFHVFFLHGGDKVLPSVHVECLLHVAFAAAEDDQGNVEILLPDFLCHFDPVHLLRLHPEKDCPVRVLLLDVLQ